MPQTSADQRFTSKDDLRQSGLDHLRRLLVDRRKNALVETGDSADGNWAFSLTTFEHAHNHVDLYRAVVGSRGGAVALGPIRQILSDLVREELAAIADKGSGGAMPREFIIQFVVGTYRPVLT